MMLQNCFWLLFLVAKFANSTPELKMVHVLVVQGMEYSYPDYLANMNTMDEDRELIMPFFEDMTNEEKLSTYELGVRLRQRYNSFLGDVFLPEVTNTLTTETDVSKMSGALVNAGLWPPAKIQLWKEDFLWQPIPTDYVLHEEDILLMGRLCPKYKEETNMVRKTSEILSLEKTYRDLFSFISNETGLGITNSRDVAYVYKNLKARISRNLTLPSWTSEIFPDGKMLNVTYLEDFILSKTKIQQKLNGGLLIKKIIKDSSALAKDTSTSENKIMIYIGDSDLLVGVMHALGAWYPHVPNVASALIFEFFYDNVSQTYEMKVLYDVGENNLTIPLQIRGCGEGQNVSNCKLDEVSYLLADILPDNDKDETLCGWPVSAVSYQDEPDPVSVTLNNTSRKTSGALILVWLCILNSIF